MKNTNKNKMKEIKGQIINMKEKYYYSFNLGWVLSVSDLTDLKVDESSSQFLKLNYGVLLISLVALFCFINIIGYILAYYLIQQLDYETKYPRLSKFIDRYKKFSLIYFCVDVLLCFVCLFLLVIFSLVFILKSNL